jgi:hypothetical protein
MITEQYINAYGDFVKAELSLTSQYNGEEYAKRIAPYYQGMYNSISQNPNDYIPFNADCNVTYYEMEFVEAVEPIRERLLELAKQNGIPTEILFIPRVKIEQGFWASVINLNVIKIVRQLFDETSGEEFETLRLFKAFGRSSKCVEDQLGSLNESYGSPDPYNLQYLLLQNLSALFS